MLAIVNRWYQILEILAAKKYVSIDDLKVQLHSSAQTIKKCISLLNEEIYGIAKIIFENGYFELRIEEYDLFLEIMNGTLKGELDFNSSTKRISYILKRLLDTNDYILIDDLSEELETSRGTVNKDIKYLKELVSNFGVQLSGKTNKGMYLEGEEFNFRLLYLYHVYDFLGKSAGLSEEVIDSLEEVEGLEQLDQISINLLKKVIDISINRIQKNRRIEEQIIHYTNYAQDNEVLETLFYHIETRCCITLSQYERDFISFPITITNTGFINTKWVDQDQLENLFRKMMTAIHDNFLIEIDDDLLYTEMQHHLMFLINRMVFHLETNDLFFNEIEKNYPFPYELAKVGITELGKQINRKPSNIEISYLAIYFELILRQTKNEEKRKIAIICSTGRGTAALIKRQVKAILGKEIVIEQFSEHAYEFENLKHYFAIFTTIPLKDSPSEVPVIRITNIFDDKWIKNEWGKLSRGNRLNQGAFTIRFEKLEKKEAYEEYLSQMVESLLHEQVVDNEFKQFIFEREQKQTTIFNNGVAFPHAVNKKQEQIVFYLGVLKEPIWTEAGMIQFIFLMGIPENINEKTEQELLELYDTMLKMVATAEIRAEILQLSQLEEFLVYIKMKGWFM